MQHVIINLLKKIYRRVNSFKKVTNDPRISIGSGTYGINENSIYIWKNTDKVEIGKYCSIAPEVKIIASGEHLYNSIANYPFKAMVLKAGNEFDTYSKGPVIIGNDVWIGYHATILSGVNIGNGAVIAAGSVVVNNIPDYAIAAGVPAKIIKFRFSPEIIESLGKISWWNWDEGLIKERIPDFYSNIDVFIKKYLPE